MSWWPDINWQKCNDWWVSVTPFGNEPNENINDESNQKINTVKEDVFSSESPNSLEMSLYSSGKQIVSYVESGLLINTGLKFLTEEQLFLRFNLLLAVMKTTNATQDSAQYNIYLREAEEILLEMQRDSSVDQEKIHSMRMDYENAFQSLPTGDGFITQKEIDFIKNVSFTVLHERCQSPCGDQFKKPSIAISVFINFFNSLGFSKVMWSREEKDFEDKFPLSDVFMLGKERKFAFSMDPLGLKEKDEEKLRKVFCCNDERLKSFYNDYTVTPIKKLLMEKEKIEQLTEQGFEMCVVLSYQKIL